MIDAKDTFYLMLRDRLAALNPARTMSVRGVTRPGILVDENELATSEILPDVFRLAWTALTINPLGPLPLAAMTCEIRYATEGSTGNAGMDRGRLLAAMDSELSTALRTAPHHILKHGYAVGFGASPLARATNVFWSDAVFGATTIAAERIERVATVEVFCYEEAGE
jgi:hypothetical protein